MERTEKISKREMLDVHKLIKTPIFKKEIKKEEIKEKKKSNIETIFVKSKKKK
jgi:hypothetical protein